MSAKIVQNKNNVDSKLLILKCALHVSQIILSCQCLKIPYCLRETLPGKNSPVFEREQKSAPTGSASA